MQDILQQTVLTVMLVSMMFAMGLRLQIKDLLGVLKNRRLMALTLVVNFIILPLLALLIVKVVGLKGDVAAGYLLCAAAPGATMSTILARQANANVAVAVVLLLVLVVVSAFVTPPLASVLFHWAGIPVDRLRTGMAIFSLLLIQVLPLVVGMVIRANQAMLAARWEPIAARFATITLFVVIVAMSIVNYRLVLEIGGLSSLVIIAFIVTSTLVGWFFPGGPPTRAATAFASGSQNIALATLLADRYLGNEGLMTVLIFGMMTYVVLLPMVMVFRKKLPQIA